jgi:hypothetical protein
VEPGFVKVIHPGLPRGSNIAEVPQIGLYQWYRSGWRLLAEGEQTPVQPPGAPEPMTEAEATAAAEPEEEK